MTKKFSTKSQLLWSAKKREREHTIKKETQRNGRNFFGDCTHVTAISIHPILVTAPLALCSSRSLIDRFSSQPKRKDFNIHAPSFFTTVNNRVGVLYSTLGHQGFLLWPTKIRQVMCVCNTDLIADWLLRSQQKISVFFWSSHSLAI